MIELEIKETGKSYGPKERYTYMGINTKRFKTLDGAKEWLHDTYGTSKRTKMYYDKDEHNTIHCGYIYGFKNQDWSHSPTDKWLQQDWVSFYKRIEVDLDKEK